MKRFKVDDRVSHSAKLSDVARAAGVSLGTASNTFNNPDRVREEVRAQVHAAARALGYSGPDPVGRLLMGGRANAIGVIPPGRISVGNAFGSPYFSEFLRGIAEVCDEFGAGLVTLSGATDSKAVAIRTALVDGFVLGHADEVPLVLSRRRSVPAVVMDMDAPPGVGTVRIDARTGARLAAAHLLGLGHRRLAILSVRREAGAPIFHASGARRELQAGFQIDREKLSGYDEAFAKAGLPPTAVPVLEGFLNPPWSAEAAARLLELVPEATGILVMADRQATALIRVAQARGRRVPADISIVGFDDAPDAGLLDPPLTTVRQAISEKGRIAARMVFENRPGDRVLPVELVVRSSTAPPPK